MRRAESFSPFAPVAITRNTFWQGEPLVTTAGDRVGSRLLRSRNAGNLESFPQNNRQHVIGKML